MSDIVKKTSEDGFADIDFSEEDDTELKSAEFVGEVEVKSVKLKDTEEGKLSQFYGENDKLVAEKIIEKKSGDTIEIRYNNIGNKETVTIRNKEKKIKKKTIYYENGKPKMVTDYGPNRSYKSMMYNADGSRISYVDKHPDGTADAIYYDTDGKNKNLIVKLDANKEVIEQHTEDA